MHSKMLELIMLVLSMPEIFILLRKKMYKCYVLLFTCAVTRAVHIELTPNLGSTCLILALRRFISRRGLPNLVISDNFKSFKAREVKYYLKENRVKWTFILEKSPWWGIL